MVLTRLQKKKLLATIVLCAVAIDVQTPRERRGNVHRDRAAAMVALGQLD